MYRRKLSPGNGTHPPGGGGGGEWKFKTEVSNNTPSAQSPIQNNENKISNILNRNKRNVKLLFLLLAVNFGLFLLTPIFAKFLIESSQIIQNSFIASILMSFGNFLDSVQIQFAIQITMLVIIMMIIPYVTQGFMLFSTWRRSLSIEILLYILTILVIGTWITENKISSSWIPSILFAVPLIVGGGTLVEFVMQFRLDHILTLAKSSQIKFEVNRITEMFANEVMHYLSVPLGFGLGVIASFLHSLDPLSAYMLCLVAISILYLLFLTISIFTSFRRLSDSLYQPETVNSEISESNRISKIINKLRTVLRLKSKLENKNTLITQQEHDLLVANLTAEIRKLYLFNSSHNIILFVTFLTIVLLILGLEVSLYFVLGTILVLYTVFGQLPYVLGQRNLHTQIMVRYSNLDNIVTYTEMEKKLHDVSPLYLRIYFINSILMTGVGGFLFLIISQVIINSLTK